MSAAPVKLADSDAPAGVTLVELVVALSVLSLMAVLLLGGMRLGLRVWESGGDRQASEQRLERADAFLRQLLAQAGRAPGMSGLSPDEAAAPGITPLATAGFIGEADRMHFVALLPYQLGSDGSYQFELSRHGNARGGNLVLGWRRDGGSTREAGALAQTVLLGGVKSFRLAYFGHLTNEPASSWHESWADRNILPALIRLDLSVALGAVPVRLTLFYPLRLSNNGV
jgi:general secretion pathway protein J